MDAPCFRIRRGQSPGWPVQVSALDVVPDQQQPAIYPRGIRRRLQEALADTPVVLLNGPGQIGKTTLVRDLASEQRPSLTLDDATVAAAARSDPQGFIRRLDAACAALIACRLLL